VPQEPTVSYTIRVSPEVAKRINAAAKAQGVSPTRAAALAVVKAYSTK